MAKEKQLDRFLASLEVTREKLDANLILTGGATFKKGVPKGCPHCGDKINFRHLPTGAWTTALYCWKCETISFWHPADRMGGNITEDVEFYRGK